MGLPPMAVLLYAVLLDRATLSQKNRYTDETERVYVIYPVCKLAAALGISETAVKGHLNLLENTGLIERQRPTKNGPNHIFVFLPCGSIKEEASGGYLPPEGKGTDRPTGGKVTVNNRKKNNKDFINSYYQHGEDESL